MKINYKILSGGLAVIVAWDLYASIKNRKIDLRNKAKFESLGEELDRACELTHFYADKLNQYEVPFDEFDRIIMENLIR